MTMTFDVARLRIARKIQATEAALDQLLAMQSELFATMVEARRETDAGPFEGHEALLRLSKVQQALLDAGGELARVHGKLVQLSEERCDDTCPPTAVSGSVVDTARAA